MGFFSAQFERVFGHRIHRRVVEKEVFDLPRNLETENGAIPNGVIAGNAHSHPSQSAARAVQSAHREDYVKLREEDADESDLLLCKHDSCRKISQASTDSANSSEESRDTGVYSSGSNVEDYGKLTKLHVSIPQAASLELDPSGLGQFRLDSTDSGYGENCAGGRVPTYLKLSSIPSDLGTAEAPPGREFDNGSDDGGDVYHQIGSSEPDANGLMYSEQRMPSYTRISSIPGPLANGIAPSVDNQDHLSFLNGNLPNGTAPSMDRPEQWST